MNFDTCERRSGCQSVRPAYDHIPAVQMNLLALLPVPLVSGDTSFPSAHDPSAEPNSGDSSQ